MVLVHHSLPFLPSQHPPHLSVSLSLSLCLSLCLSLSVSLSLSLSLSLALSLSLSLYISSVSLPSLSLPPMPPLSSFPSLPSSYYISIKILIQHICRRVFFFCATFLAFWRVGNCTTFFEHFIFTAATSKTKMRSCTTGLFVSVPSQGSLFAPPQSGTDFRGGTISNFCFALCFPMFGTNWAFFKNRLNIDSQMGTSVVQFLTFGHVGLNVLTKHVSFVLLSLLLFFLFLVFDVLFALFPQTSKKSTRPRKQQQVKKGNKEKQRKKPRKKERQKARKTERQKRRKTEKPKTNRTIFTFRGKTVFCVSKTRKERNKNKPKH